MADNARAIQPHRITYFKSASSKLKPVSGIIQKPVKFLLCAETNFSTTNGIRGDSFQIISCASLYNRVFSCGSLVFKAAAKSLSTCLLL